MSILLYDPLYEKLQSDSTRGAVESKAGHFEGRLRSDEQVRLLERTMKAEAKLARTRAAEAADLAEEAEQRLAMAIDKENRAKQVLAYEGF